MERQISNVTDNLEKFLDTPEGMEVRMNIKEEENRGGEAVGNPEHMKLAQELLVHIIHHVEDKEKKIPDLKVPENEDRQYSLQTSDKTTSS